MGKVYIVDGSRTPFLKWNKFQNEFAASDLAVATGRQLLDRQNFSSDLIDEVIIGCAMPAPTEANIARLIGLRLGLNIKTPAWTVMRNCASGMQSLDSAYQSILLGRSQIVLAGGTEAMSRAPVQLSSKMINWLAKFGSQKSKLAKFKQLLTLRPNYFKLVFGLLCGLTDSFANMNMGQTAEELAYRFSISREQMDLFAKASQDRAYQTSSDGLFKEITNLYSNKGNLFIEDTGIRKDTTLEALQKLKPTFDRKFGKVTAGNSSQITDGAALLILASEEAVEKYSLPVLARIVDINWAGLEPSVMGLGPVYASAPLLTKHNLVLNDIDYWEINEAFAVQVLACLKAFNDEDFCKKELNLSNRIGNISHDKLNIDGGSIALGHPIGATGARITLHLAHVLRSKKAKTGIASLCIGGGQGGAVLLTTEL